MFQSKRPSTAGGRRKFRVGPVLSVFLIICYAGVSAWFLIGRPEAIPEPPEQEEEEYAAGPPVVIFPESAGDPPLDSGSGAPGAGAVAAMPPAVKVKGMYYSSYRAAEDESIARFIELSRTSEINAIVIDVKNDSGEITFITETQWLSETARLIIPDIEGLVANLKSHGIYTIARVVCFKDPVWCAKHPEAAIQTSWGERWRDRSGISWLDPYKTEAWDYLAAVCLEAARVGFDEVQLDYVRFPADGDLSDIDFGAAGEEKTKPEIIGEFAAYVRELLAAEGVRLSADVFGIVAVSNSDANNIGQNLGILLQNTDSICPMIYPSHFANKKQNGTGSIVNGVLFEKPDFQPYDVVYNILIATGQHLKDDAGQGVVRPYLQDFTASYLGEGYYQKYTAQQVREQIKAVYDAGFDEWILWNHISIYTEDAFLPVEVQVLGGYQNE